MKILLLKCPKCKHNMKYQSRDSSLIGKRKRCVYCGASFSINSRIIKKF